MDTSSFPAYLRSLNLKCRVNTAPGRVFNGPPLPLLESALRLGLGRLLFDTPRNRELVSSIGLRPEILLEAGRRMHSRAMWRAVWEELAGPHVAAGEAAARRGDREGAVADLRSAIVILGLAYSGDGYYFHTPMRERPRVQALKRRLYGLLHQLQEAPVQRIVVADPRGKIYGLLHLPPAATWAPHRGIPALLAIHPLGGDKESYDWYLRPFREAGYATFCIDLPGHGEGLAGPRLQPDSERTIVTALKVLAAHPAIDAERIGVMGGSLGGFFALRTAAASPMIKACLTYAAPFNVSFRLARVLPGIADNFATVTGATTAREAGAQALQFNLGDVLERIECPVCIVHGTLDHVCDFTATYAIASRLKAPLTIHPLPGVDHEAANPYLPHLAQPGIEWLGRHL